MALNIRGAGEREFVKIVCRSDVSRHNLHGKRRKGIKTKIGEASFMEDPSTYVIREPHVFINIYDYFKND